MRNSREAFASSSSWKKRIFNPWIVTASLSFTRDRDLRREERTGKKEQIKDSHILVSHFFTLISRLALSSHLTPYFLFISPFILSPSSPSEMENRAEWSISGRGRQSNFRLFSSRVPTSTHSVEDLTRFVTSSSFSSQRLTFNSQFPFSLLIQSLSSCKVCLHPFLHPSRTFKMSWGWFHLIPSIFTRLKL